MVINKSVKALFDNYPEPAKKALYQLRDIILSTASEQCIKNLKESLKWGEASYACPQGSPIRIDWKEKHPQTVGIYFNCKTSLVETFRATMGDHLDFIGNRELRLQLNKPFPLDDIKLCLTLAMRYKDIKNLPLLGM